MNTSSEFSGTARKDDGLLPSDLGTRFSAALRRRSYWYLSAWARARLARHSVLPVVEEFVAGRPQESLPPVFCDLWFLYRTARERKPQIILEFGSGCSTAVFAQAIVDNGQGHLISIDAVQSWAESTADSMPPRLRRHCEIITSPLVELEYDGTRVFRHTNVPQVVPNYVYLDGPPLSSRVQVAIDVLDMEERLPPDFFMVIDGRRTNTEFLRTHFTKHYQFQHRSLINNSTFRSK